MTITRAAVSAFLALGAGCGRVWFDAVPGANDADVDAIPDTDNDTGPPLCGMPFGTWKLTPPTLLADINDQLTLAAGGVDSSEYDAVFSTDDLSLYFTSNASGINHAWRADRATTSSPFTAVTELGPDVNNGPLVFGFQPIGDDAVVTAPYGSPVGGMELWYGRYALGSWSWSLSALSTTASEIDVRMSGDKLAAYYPVMGDIYRVTRADAVNDFSNPVILSDLSSVGTEEAPSPAFDGAGIFFASNRPGGAGERDIYYAESTGPTTFGAPYRLAAVASTDFDGEPAFSTATCELVFSRSNTPANLYRSFVVPR